MRSPAIPSRVRVVEFKGLPIVVNASWASRKQVPGRCDWLGWTCAHTVSGGRGSTGPSRPQRSSLPQLWTTLLSPDKYETENSLTSNSLTSTVPRFLTNGEGSAIAIEEARFTTKCLNHRHVGGLRSSSGFSSRCDLDSGILVRSTP